jgi:hypothetical protein
MAKNKQSPEASRGVDYDVDRYPTFRDVLRRVLDEVEAADSPIERLEVTTLASGEATYRYWLPRAEEPEGGYLPPA